MFRFRSFCKLPRWVTALLLAAFMGGCGSGGGDGQTGSDPDQGPQPTAAGVGTGVGGDGRGPAPVPLGTSADFVILSVLALSNVPPSVVTGDVGLTVASGALIGLTCAEVTGKIYSIDNSGPPCKTTDAARLILGEKDADAAYYDGVARAPDYVDLAAGNIGGLNLGPATYKWNTAVVIPSNLTLTGGPNDVWIFQIEKGLSVSSGVQIILRGGALPQNVYWMVLWDSDLGMNSQFAGIFLGSAGVFMKSGASISGKLLSMSVHLDQNTVGP